MFRTVRRKVNAKAVVLLLGTAAALGTGVHFLHAFQVKHNAKDLLAQAADAKAAGQPGKAADCLAQYIGLQPKDNDALAEYALLLEKVTAEERQEKSPADYRALRERVFFYLERALRTDPSLYDVRRAAARVGVELRQLDNVRLHLEELKGAGPLDAEMLKVLARCEFLAKQHDKADEAYREALDKDKHDIGLWQEYLALLVRLERFDQADDAVAGLTQANGKDVKARLTAARYFLGREGAANKDKAQEHIDYALKELGAKSPEALLLAAEVAAARRLPKDALAHLRRGVQEHPKDEALRAELIRMMRVLGDRSGAEKEFAKLPKKLPADPLHLWNRGNSMIDLGKDAELDAVLARLKEQKLYWAVSFLDARRGMKQKEWAKARVTLEGVRGSRLPSAMVERAVDVLLAECYAAQGNPDQQVAAAKRVLEGEPANAAARAWLAAGLAALGQTHDALREYERLGPAVAPELARLRFLRELAKRKDARSWDDVDKALRDVPEERLRQPDLLRLRVDLLLAKDKAKEARDLLEAERQRDPKQVTPWLLLADLARTEGNDKVLPALDEAERAAGRKVDWPVARARHYARVGGADSHKQLKALERQLSAWDGADRDRLAGAVAEGFVLLGDAPSARKLWRDLARWRPDDLYVRLTLLDAYARAGDEGEVRRLAVEIAKVEGEKGPLGYYAEATLGWVRARAGQREALAGAREALAKAKSRRLHWPWPDALRGELELVEGHKDAAAGHFDEAIRLGDYRVGVLRRALELRSELGQTNEVRQLLEKLPAEARALPQFRRFWFVDALVGAERDKDGGTAARQAALKRAQQSVPAGSKAYTDYLWLGQAAWLLGEKEEAEKAFRQALKLNDAVPETWVALVLVLARTDKAKAKQEMDKAERHLPRDKVPLALGPCHEALGEAEAAEKQFRAARAYHPADPRMVLTLAGFLARRGKADEADKLFRSVLDDSKLKAPDATVRAVRRTLALRLALRRSYPEFKEALALVEANLKGEPGSLPDKRVKGVVLATRPEHRAEAIELFKGLRPLSTPTTSDILLLLANLHEAALKPGDEWRAEVWPYLEKALDADPKNPALLAHVTRALLRQDNRAAARDKVDELAKVAPKAFETLELQARVHKLEGQEAKAAELLLGYAKGKDGRPDWAALVLADLGRADDAEKLLRDLVKAGKRPEDSLTLARHLARQKKKEKTDEALALCAAAWKTKCHPVDVASTTLFVVRAAHVTGKARDAAIDRIAAAPDSPKSVQLLSLLAEAEDLRGRRDQAIKYYRAVLDLAPKNVVALNNLGYLQALHAGDDAGGLKRINQAIELAGPVAELLDTRACIHIEAKRYKEAHDDLHKALKQERRALTCFHLAWAEHDAGNQKAASDWLKEAFKRGLKEDALHPLDRKAYGRLAALGVDPGAGG